jgi:hypothetical protein
LWVSDCKKVGFWDHHDNKCKKARSNCNYLGKRGHEAGAELIARLVGHNTLEPQELFLDASTKRRRLHDEAAEAWAHLKKALKVPKRSNGTISHRHPAAPFLITAILGRFGLRRLKGTAKLCDLFRSTDELRLALTRRILRAFDLPSAEGLGED